MIHQAVARLQNSPRKLSASVLSLGLHGLLLLAVGLLWQPSLRPDPPEPERQAGIVLTQRAAPQTKMLVDAESQAAEQAAADAAATSADSTGEAAADAGLPGGGEAASLALPEIQLPASDVPLADGSLLVPRLQNGGSGSRPSILPGDGDAEILAEEAANRAAKAALGPATQVSIFGSAPAQGRSFVFAIDRSKSMGGDGLNALAAAQRELAKALAKLQPNHRFQVLAYHHSCLYYDTPRLIPATAERTAGVPKFIDNLAAFGGTVHEMALRAALAMEPDAVFLLTDGGDPYLNDIQQKNIQKLAADRTAIHCIQFGFGPADESADFLRELARNNNGGYTYVDMSLAAARVAQ